MWGVKFTRSRTLIYSLPNIFRKTYIILVNGPPSVVMAGINDTFVYQCSVKWNDRVENGVKYSKPSQTELSTMTVLITPNTSIASRWHPTRKATKAPIETKKERRDFRLSYPDWNIMCDTVSPIVLISMTSTRDNVKKCNKTISRPINSPVSITNMYNSGGFVCKQHRATKRR